MNKLFILLLSIVSLQTLPMGFLTNNRLINTFAFLKQARFVKPIAQPARQYFTKSINYLKNVEQAIQKDKQKYLATLQQYDQDPKLKHTDQKIVIRVLLNSINFCEDAENAIKSNREELEQLNSSFNQQTEDLKKAVSTIDNLVPISIFEKIKKKDGIYNEILKKKNIINNNYKTWEVSGEKFKLPEE